MYLGNPPADGKPESNSTQFAGARLVRAIESLKHIGKIRSGNPDSRVAHFGYREAVIRPQGDFHLSMCGRVLYGVIDQDQKQPAKRTGVSPNPKRVAGNLLLKRDLLGFGKRASCLLYTSDAADDLLC